MCSTALPKLSPADEAFNEISTALKILEEAIERIASKTSGIRYSRPCDPYCQKDKVVEEYAPLVMRLNGIKDSICSHADTINSLSDDIQL